MVDETRADDVEFVEEPDVDDETGDVLPTQVSQAVLHSTDWTTETLLSQLTRQNIDLNPHFQRRDAWPIKKKSRLIESLIIGFPVPQIVLAERAGQRGKYLVLDGKQRLLTLLQFAGEARESRHNGFALRALEIRTDLNGKTLFDMRGNFLLQDDVDALYNQTIRTVAIRNWPSTAFLRQVFKRLNTSSVPLSPQELRLSMFPGPFVNFIDKSARESGALRLLLHIDEPDFRMRDTELLLRFLAFRCFLHEYAGNLRAFLDDTCRRLNETWPQREPDIACLVADFEVATSSATQIFGQTHAGRKWTGTGFEARLNRAVLDAQLYYLSDPRIRDAAMQNSERVLAAFKRLCDESESFRDSIETTTKSLQATYTRLSLWGQSLAEAIPVTPRIPQWCSETNRIVP